MNPNTQTCDTQYNLVQGFKSAFAQLTTANELGLPDINGNIIPWSTLFSANDGCEIQRMRGLHDCHCHCPEHNQRFKLSDKDTHEPLIDVYYEIKDSQGHTISGRTDSNGYTEKIHTSSQDDVCICIFVD